MGTKRVGHIALRCAMIKFLQKRSDCYRLPLKHRSAFAPILTLSVS